MKLALIGGGGVRSPLFVASALRRAERVGLEELCLMDTDAQKLAIFGELDTPEGVKANVRAIEQIMNQAGRRDYLIKVYPSARHNLMEAPRDNTSEYVRLKRFPPGLFETMVDWTTSQLRRRVGQ